MTTSTTLMTIFAIVLMIQVSTINTQTTSSIQSLPNTMAILISISASGEEIDERTAEDIRTAYSSPAVSSLLNSSSASPLTQYFFDETNDTTSPIKMLQAINSLYVIKVMYDIANKIQSTPKSYVYWNKLTLMATPMQRTLNTFFNQISSTTTSAPSLSPFPEGETAPPTEAPSIAFKFTPLVKEALNVTPSFTLENNPLLSNLTVDPQVSGATNALLSLARLVSVARQLSVLINITTDLATFTMLSNNLKSFQRVLYSINSLTEFRLVDQITEFDLLLISAPYIQLSSYAPAAKKRNNNNNMKANPRKLKTRTLGNRK